MRGDAVTASLPHITSLEPKTSVKLTPEQCIVLWMEMTDNNEQLVLNRLREEVGPDGDVIAAYRRWCAKQMEEHDEGLIRMLERLNRCEAGRGR
jgi:hypothetical protein